MPARQLPRRIPVGGGGNPPSSVPVSIFGDTVSSRDPLIIHRRRKADPALRECDGEVFIEPPEKEQLERPLVLCRPCQGLR
jgi:hypothetical protein